MSQIGKTYQNSLFSVSFSRKFAPGRDEEFRCSPKDCQNSAFRDKLFPNSAVPQTLTTPTGRCFSYFSVEIFVFIRKGTVQFNWKTEKLKGFKYIFLNKRQAFYIPAPASYHKIEVLFWKTGSALLLYSKRANFGHPSVLFHYFTLIKTDNPEKYKKYSDPRTVNFVREKYRFQKSQRDLPFRRKHFKTSEVDQSNNKQREQTVCLVM